MKTELFQEDDIEMETGEVETPSETETFDTNDDFGDERKKIEFNSDSESDEFDDSGATIYPVLRLGSIIYLVFS